MNERDLREQERILGVASEYRKKGNEKLAKEIEDGVIRECNNDWYFDFLRRRQTTVVWGSKEVRVDL